MNVSNIPFSDTFNASENAQAIKYTIGMRQNPYLVIENFICYPHTPSPIVFPPELSFMEYTPTK